MIQMILVSLLSPFFAQAPSASLAAVRPCVWPNRCGATVSAPVIAQFKPCVWPNTCGSQNTF